MSGPNEDHAGHEDADAVLGMAAHEIKNALAPLLMALQILEQKQAAAGAVSDEIVQAQRQARRIARIATDLLDVTRFGTGQIALRREPVDVVALVAEVVETFRLGAARTVALSSDQGGPLVVAGDDGHLTEVVMNLLDNAAKYSPPASSIDVHVKARGSVVSVTVTDRGFGIAPADQRRLFQRYFRAAATAEKARGLGLGLFLCRAIVEGHGGALGVESVPGAGSTFWLDLPLVPDPR